MGATLTELEIAPAARRLKPELLAPAGDWECARAAVENGADAIYFGLERFNARMRAHNFTQADLPALMEFLHKRGVRGYVTFNTLVFSDELNDAEEYLRSIIASGVDAAIVQDAGICRLIRQLSPDFPIHCSTQMTISSPAGVEFASDLGAQLVVLARENSLADIAAIREAERIRAEQPGARPAIPLEVFVHGALCVAYSGQCLTSESLGGRSANRGECAQACRLPYDLISDGQKVDLGDRKYLLSPQDLAGIDVLADIVKSGVASLKIEGRLKSPEYVASVTRVYRQALDKIQPRAEGAAAEAAAKYELEMTFSRGLYTGWFRGNNNQELAHGRFGTKRGVYLGEVTRVAGEAVAVKLVSALKTGDGIVFDAGKPEAGEQGGRVHYLDPNGADTLLRFGRGDIDLSRVRPGNKVWKTSDPALERELRTTFEGDKIRYCRPVQMEVHGRSGTPLTLILSDGEGHVVKAVSLAPLEKAEQRPLDTDYLKAQLGRLGGTAYQLKALDNRLEGPVILPVSELNRARREAVAALDSLRAAPRRWTLSPDHPPLPTAGLSREPLAQPELVAVVRSREQLEAAYGCQGVAAFYCEFENPKHYRDAVASFRAWRAGQPETAAPPTIWVAAPRVFKPGEEWIIKMVLSSEADGYLVRNYDHLKAFAGQRCRGDFSLNVANPWTADLWINHHGLERVTASYDLNIAQLDSLLKATPPAWFDITIHQHMPMFHMEHCVFCAFLSKGKDYHDCGRPCESHSVSVRDRVGADLPLKADAGCRNTVYNNRAQTGAEYAEHLMSLGARSFRVEFVNEGASEVVETLTAYRGLLQGSVSGADLWRSLRLVNQLGVTRGQMETGPRTIIKKT